MIKQLDEKAKPKVRPKVGLGVLVFNQKRQILLGKRKNAHGSSSFGPPGGHLEFGETFETCAIRELMEETGLKISDPTFLGITNDIFELENKHYVSIFMKADLTTNQQVQNLEPHKVEEWHWFSLEELPENLFLPLKALVSGNVYSGRQSQALQLYDKSAVSPPNNIAK